MAVRKELRKRALDLYRSGKTFFEVARITGVGESTAWRWVRTEGISRTASEAQGVAPGTRERALDLYRSGKSTYEVARTIGVDASTVGKWARTERISRTASEARAIAAVKDWRRAHQPEEVRSYVFTADREGRLHGNTDV